MFRTLLPTPTPALLFDRWLDEAFQAPVNVARRTDVRETGEQYVVRCEVPGFEASDLHVQLERDLLTIRAEQERDGERRSFARSLRLAVPVDAEKIQAELKNGVLTLVLPKHEAARPRRIAIRSAVAPASPALEDRTAPQAPSAAPAPGVEGAQA